MCMCGIGSQMRTAVKKVVEEGMIWSRTTTPSTRPISNPPKTSQQPNTPVWLGITNDQPSKICFPMQENIVFHTTYTKSIFLSPYTKYSFQLAFSLHSSSLLFFKYTYIDQKFENINYQKKYLFQTKRTLILIPVNMFLCLTIFCKVSTSCIKFRKCQ